MNSLVRKAFVVFFIAFFSTCAAQERSKKIEPSLKIRAGKSYGKFEWKTSKNGSAVIWSNRSEPFTWSGAVVGGYANGEGYLEFYGSKGQETCYVSLLFGADEDEYKVTGNSGNRYLGDYRPGTLIPEGRGVLIMKSGSVYAGDFKNNAVNGHAVKFINNQVVYDGAFRDSKYNGYGRLYKNQKLYYEGTFVNNKKEGNGIEYISGATFKGNYHNDKRNGLFEIKKEDVIRLVSYSDGVADLINCKVYLPDGSMWEGPLTEDFVRNGEGKTTTSDGAVSFETRKNGELNGQQKITASDGSVFAGEIVNGRKNGYGELIKANGIEYYGTWKDDKPSGYGEWIKNDGWCYDGEWKNGLFDGEGILVFPGSSYEGHWKQGKMSGYGVLTYDDLQYEGNWNNGCVEGYGIVQYADGSYYEGNWKENRRHGYGEYFWPDGSSYSGDWTNDIPNGNAYVVLSNGDIYSGDIESAIENNRVYTCYSGYGSYVYANGERYEGTFVENRKEGFGTYYYDNGNIYEGEFFNNLPNGKGRFHFSDGSYYEGDFNKGNFAGTGSLFIPDEDSYIIFTSSLWSDFNNVLPNSGSMLFPNGDEFVGAFVNGNPVDGTWTTQEDRIRNEQQRLQEQYNVKTLEHNKFEEFCKNHEKGFRTFLSVSKNIVTGLNIAATICTFIPCPPLQAVALATSVVLDVADVALAGADVAVNTAIYNYDKKELIKNLDEEGLVALKEDYKKQMINDAITIGFTVGLASVNAIRSGVQAKKIMEKSPEIAKTIKALNAAEKTADVAKKSKGIGNSLLRGVVELAYPGVGKALIKEHGDDATRLIFKYGENAIDVISKGGKLATEFCRKGGPKATQVLLKRGDKALSILKAHADDIDDVAKLFARHGDKGVDLVRKYGDDIVSIYAKYGDESIDLISHLGRNNGRVATKVIREYGDNAVKQLSKVLKDNPGEYNKAVRYLNAYGEKGLKNLQKWNGKIPPEITNNVINIEKRRIASAIAKETKEILAKPGIKLTAEQLDAVMAKPHRFRNVVYDATGKNFRDGFQEFFIRLSKESPEQMKKLWSSPNVKDFIKDRGIRPGGVHEWLMCENFMDFLTDAKWGKDGPYLANAITELVQNTQNVRFKNGGAHGGNYSGVFHNILWQKINECNGASEVFDKIRRYASEVLTQDSYDEFCEILDSVLRK